MLLVWFGGPTTSVHHPQEIRLDPRHPGEGKLTATKSAQENKNLMMYVYIR